MNNVLVIAVTPVGKRDCGIPGASEKPFSGNYTASGLANAKDSSTNKLCFHTAASNMWKHTCGKCHFKGLYPFKGAVLKVNNILGLSIRNCLLGLSCRK